MGAVSEAPDLNKDYLQHTVNFSLGGEYLPNYSQTIHLWHLYRSWSLSDKFSDMIRKYHASSSLMQFLAL